MTASPTDPRTDLSEVPSSELKRRLVSLVEEYDRELTAVGRLMLKIERVQAEMAPVMAELGRREPVDA